MASHPMTGRSVIRGGCVLTLGHRTPNFAEADVLIDGGRVVEIGRDLRVRDAEVIDASDTIVMPGFVDAHRHAWQTLSRNLGDPWTSGSAPVDAATRFGEHHEPDDVYAATLLGLLAAVEAGVTTVVDWSDIQVDDTFTEAVLAAHADSGARTVLVHAVPPWAGTRDDALDAVRRLVERRGGIGDTTTVAWGMAHPIGDDPDRTAHEWTAIRDLGLRIHAHVGTASGDRGIVARLAGSGGLADDITLVHCTHLSDPDLDAIASSGAGVVLAPSTEMADGFGTPPVQSLIDRGIRPGLGVDNERLAPGDIFAQMRATISLQHGTHFDLKLAGKGGLPNLMSTRDVIRHATVDGAAVAGLAGVTGSLEPGMQADIVVLRTDRPNIFPINDPIGAVVWGMDTSNLDWVLVAGEVRMRAGESTADLGSIRALATAARQRVGAASGLLAASGQEGPA